MLLGPGGIDVWYVDESSDHQHFAMSAVAIPLLRTSAGAWEFVWDQHLDRAREFRREIKAIHKIPVRKELHAVKLVGGRGRFLEGSRQFTRRQAAGLYRWLLTKLSFLPDAAVISVVGSGASRLYGKTRLEATLYALLQRMERSSKENNRNGMVFFDDGHGEYRTLYRKARRHLPTGSDRGTWPDGKPTANLPMKHFFKDGNVKFSQHSQFLQIVDLIAYAAFLKCKAEAKALTPWQEDLGLGDVYDSLPRKILNRRAARRDPTLGIVRL